MKKEDIEFLKELQNELRTQDDDGTANPLYWGIMEKKLVPVPSGYGEPYIIGCDCHYTLAEFVEMINDEIEELDEEAQENWKDLDKTDFNDVLDFAKEYIDSDYDEMEFDLIDVLSQDTGCFLTKRSAKKYIDNYSYNHTEPRTYAMCAYRNFEYERLLKILTNMNIDDIKID